MLEILLTAAGTSVTIAAPLLAYLLKQQGRIVALETWRDLKTGESQELEGRIIRALERIEQDVRQLREDQRVDRQRAANRHDDG